MRDYKPKIVTRFVWEGTDADLRAMCARVSARCVSLWETELASRGYAGVVVKSDDDISKLNENNGRVANQVSYYPNVYIISEGKISDADKDAVAQLQRDILGSAFKNESVPDGDIEKIRWRKSTDWQEDKPKEAASRR